MVFLVTSSVQALDSVYVLVKQDSYQNYDYIVAFKDRLNAEKSLQGFDSKYYIDSIQCDIPDKTKTIFVSLVYAVGFGELSGPFIKKISLTREEAKSFHLDGHGTYVAKLELRP